MPKVTVLMPVYNAEQYLREAIESILNQTFKDFEFLIIDDGSTDNSKDIILSYNDPRIRFVAHEENKKLITTLNEGIELANAPLIARMDADDISMLERIEKQVRFMDENQDHVLLGTACEIIDLNGKKIGSSSSFYDNESLRLSLALYTSFAHGSVMFRKESALKAGGYSLDAYLAEDYDLWIRLAKIGKIANLPEKLFKYRTNPDGECATNMERQQEVLRNINEKYWKRFDNHGLLSSSFKFLSKKWIIENVEKDQHSTIKKQLSYFHIKFAEKYIRDKEYVPAMLHMSCSCMLYPMGFIRKAISSGLYFLKIREKKVVNNNLSIGVLILFFEKVDQTIECIQSFLPSGLPIYVLNNNSSNESSQELKDFCKNYPQITIFESETNLGPTGGRNFLITHTKEKWLFFADNDIKIKTKDWLKILINQIKKYSEIEVFIFRVYNLHEKAYSKFYPITVSQGLIERREDSKSKLVNIFPGGASCINRNMFNRLGLYDENIFAFEEMEMSLRALVKKAPIKGRLVNDIVLIHDHRVAKSEADKIAANTRYDRKKLQLSAAYLEVKYDFSLNKNWCVWSEVQKKIITDGVKIKKKTLLSIVIGKARRILELFFYKLKH